MYRLLMFMLCLPVMAAAQDCKLSTETDPFTKLTKISTGFIAFDGGSATIDADSKEISILFSIEGGDNCFDNNSTGYIFFEGVKTKMTIRNGGTMNCEGLFQLVFKNNPNASTPSMLNRFMTQKINHIIFTANNKKEFTVNLSPADQEKLIFLSNCLVNSAKTIAK